MTTYTQRDLRAVGLLALLLFGVGGVLVLVALIRVVSGAGNTLLLWIGAVAASSLGTALKLKLRELHRNRGSEEPDRYGNVFE